MRTVNDCKLKWTRSDILLLIAYASSEGVDKIAHRHILIRAFAARTYTGGSRYM